MAFAQTADEPTTSNLPELIPSQTKPEDAALDFSEDERIALPKLSEMLQYRRPAGGVTEKAFRARFLDQIPGIRTDAIGNMIVDIGEGPHTILWSCHTDSVHRSEGMQQLQRDGQFICLANDSKSDCLGADDAAGIWLMTEMIEAGIPGRYVFHHAEERGCQGSKHILKETPELLDGIQAAIAFDRRGYNDIITHQMYGRCCSDAFAKSLGAQLGRNFEPSPHGVYTDTATYTHVIPECTNVSVGYFNEHSQNESLNIVHAILLRNALIEIDTSELVIERDPKASSLYDYDDDEMRWGYGVPSYSGHSSQGRGYGKGYSLGTWPGNGDTPPDSLEALLDTYPISCAKVLQEYGFTVDDLWDEINRLQD